MVRVMAASPTRDPNRTAAETVIFHMCRAEEWRAAVARGRYDGSSQDQADGFIHFSTARQLPGSAAKHRAGQAGLVVVTVETAALGPALRWEPARNGQLFPHLHGPLIPDQILRVDNLPLDADGRHVLPEHVAAFRAAAGD